MVILFQFKFIYFDIKYHIITFQIHFNNYLYEKSIFKFYMYYHHSLKIGNDKFFLHKFGVFIFSFIYFFSILIYDILLLEVFIVLTRHCNS